MPKALIAERVGVLLRHQCGDRAVGERDVDPRRLEWHVLAAKPIAQRAIRANERERIVHWRDLRGDPTQPPLCVCLATQLEEEEMLVVLSEARDDVSLDLIARRFIEDRLWIGSSRGLAEVCAGRGEAKLLRRRRLLQREGRAEPGPLVDARGAGASSRVS